MTTIWSVTRWSGQVALFRLNTWASSTLHCALGIRPCSHTVQTTSTVHCTTPCHLKLWWQQKSLHSSSMQNSAVHFTVFKWCKGTKMCSIRWAQRTEYKVGSTQKKTVQRSVRACVGRGIRLGWWSFGSRELPPIQWRSLADGVLKSDNDTSRALIKYKTQIT